MTSNRACCGHAATVYKVDASNNLTWARDYYSGSIAAEVPSGGAYSSDQDNAGNVYQAGPGNYPAVVFDWSKPQTRTLFNVVSWDSSGNLRWKWSEAPTGTLAFGLRSAPVQWSRCRCSANGQILLGQQIGIGHAGFAAAIDSNANLIWWVTSDLVTTGLPVLVDGGNLTSLWVQPGFAGLGIVTMLLVNNLTGAATTLHMPQAPGTNVPLNGTVDHDDSQYLYGFDGISKNVICKVVSGAVIWQIDPITIFPDVLIGNDDPVLMRADGDALICGSFERTIALSKVDGSVIWSVLTPAGVSWWPGAGIPPVPYAAARTFVPTSGWQTLLDTHARTVQREWIDARPAYGQARMDDCSLSAAGGSIWSGAARSQPPNQLLPPARCKWHVLNIGGTPTWAKVFDDCHNCGRSACPTPGESPQLGMVRFTNCGP